MDSKQVVGECPRCRKLEARVRVLEDQVRILTAALEESRRAEKRQAAPFRKSQRVVVPKKPGRKSGEDYGKHARRGKSSGDSIHNSLGLSVIAYAVLALR